MAVPVAWLFFLRQQIEDGKHQAGTGQLLRGGDDRLGGKQYRRGDGDGDGQAGDQDRPGKGSLRLGRHAIVHRTIVIRIADFS